MSKMEHIENTVGAYRVGLSFNPSGNDRVDTVKLLAAELINHMAEITASGGHGHREAIEAATRIEDACMWAVKAITKPPLPDHLDW